MKRESLEPTGRSKPVGVWIRVSTEDQARGESPEHHERRARYYAESKGWQIKEVYHLEAVSGKSVKPVCWPECVHVVSPCRATYKIGKFSFIKLIRRSWKPSPC